MALACCTKLTRNVDADRSVGPAARGGYLHWPTAYHRTTTTTNRPQLADTNIADSSLPAAASSSSIAPSSIGSSSIIFFIRLNIYIL